MKTTSHTDGRTKKWQFGWRYLTQNVIPILDIFCYDSFIKHIKTQKTVKGKVSPSVGLQKWTEVGKKLDITINSGVSSWYKNANTMTNQPFVRGISLTVFAMVTIEIIFLAIWVINESYRKIRSSLGRWWAVKRNGWGAFVTPKGRDSQDKCDIFGMYGKLGR